MQNQDNFQDLPELPQTAPQGPGIKETPMVNISAHVRIFDPETQETMLETRA